MAINEECTPIYVTEICGKVPGSYIISSSALENFHILKNSNGVLFYLHGYNDNGLVYVQLFDTISLPNEGEVPLLTYKVPSRENFDVCIPSGGIKFTIGICVCMSSNPDSLKLSIGNGSFITAIIK